MSDYPVTNETTPADDVLYGVSAIAAFVGRPDHKVYYDLKRGLLPAGRWGQQWIASKARLREHFANVTSGAA